MTGNPSSPAALAETRRLLVGCAPARIDPCAPITTAMTNTRSTAADIAAFETWWRQYHDRWGWL